ncbi:MAG: hypothetical protein WDZ41_05450 [Candidatus Babeliales bacterium]
MKLFKIFFLVLFSTISLRIFSKDYTFVNSTPESVRFEVWQLGDPVFGLCKERRLTKLDLTPGQKVDVQTGGLCSVGRIIVNQKTRRRSASKAGTYYIHKYGNKYKVGRSTIFN